MFSSLPTRAAPRKNVKNDNDLKTSTPRQAAWKNSPKKKQEPENRKRETSVHKLTFFLNYYSGSHLLLLSESSWSVWLVCYILAPCCFPEYFSEVWQYKWNVKYDFGMKSTHYTGKRRGREGKSFKEEPVARVNQQDEGRGLRRRPRPPKLQFGHRAAASCPETSLWQYKHPGI